LLSDGIAIGSEVAVGEIFFIAEQLKD